MLPCLKIYLMRKWFLFTLFLEGTKFWPRQDLARKTIHGTVPLKNRDLGACVLVGVVPFI